MRKHFYDRNGSQIGSLDEWGGKTRFYDRNGCQIGSADGHTDGAGPLNYARQTSFGSSNSSSSDSATQAFELIKLAALVLGFVIGILALVFKGLFWLYGKSSPRAQSWIIIVVGLLAVIGGVYLGIRY